MSRIKDALKKAKFEREGQTVSFPPNESVSKPANKPKFGKTQTKVINYSEKAAKEYKLLTPYFSHPDIEERFKLLRTKIFADTQANDDRTILITSSLDKEGKTFLAANLAISVAREVDQTVLLVDVNLKNPSVLKTFGIESEGGLTDYLLYNKPLSDILIRPGIEKLVILPAGKPLENSAELLRSRKMQELILEMKHRYEGRYIFFDGPSLLSCVDAVVLHPNIDKILFVIESGRTKPETVSEALNLLEQEKILGTVINKKNLS